MLADGVIVTAAGIEQGISENREAGVAQFAAGQEPLPVRGFGQAAHENRPPSRLEGAGAEGGAEHVAKETHQAGRPAP
jgi:hypothetical protein